MLNKQHFWPFCQSGATSCIWPFCQSGAVSCILGIHCTVYVAVYACCSKLFLCHIVVMHTLAMITSSEMHAIKVYLPCVYPRHHAHDKMYQAVSLLSRESLQTRLLCRDDEKTSPFSRPYPTTGTRSRQVNTMVEFVVVD